MIPVGFNADACVARRNHLAEEFAGSALVEAGRAISRNYAANQYPFRASSHFLYLVGAPIEGAKLLLRNGNWTLYVPAPPPGDELWHGAAPSLTELGSRLELDVQPMIALAAREVARVDTAGSEADRQLAAALAKLRLVHDDAAQAELRRAADATTAAHRAGMRATKPDVTESQVRAAMEHVIIGRGMCCAYQPIVSVHGEVLHNAHQHNVCNDGDLLLADVGAETAGGWASDVTRTWPVGGRFSGTQSEIYRAVLAAQQAAIAMVAPTVRYRDVHLCAAKVLTEQLVELGIMVGDPDELVADGVHAMFFPHGVGHLLGLDVHDMEDLGDLAGYAPGRERSSQFGLSYLRLDRDLEPGMAVTIEPGFYQVPAILEDPARREWVGDRINWDQLSKFSDVRGIRIEDDVLVTPSGRLVLTAGLPTELEEVTALMAG